MLVTPIPTHTISPSDTDILAILDTYLPALEENSVVAVTSKIISITEGRVVPIEKISPIRQAPFSRVQGRQGKQVSRVPQGEEKNQKDELIEQESEYFIPRAENPYHIALTITNGVLVANAGIDESNGGGNYILWPKNPQKSANTIRDYLREKYSLQNLGVIITDSKTTPLRWGVTAIAIAYSGFSPLKDYVGKKDLFGRPFVFEKMSVIDNLASAAGIVMGEGSERTPIAVFSDLQNVEFQEENPSQEELKILHIQRNEDLYASLLSSVSWKKGKKV